MGFYNIAVSIFSMLEKIHSNKNIYFKSIRQLAFCLEIFESFFFSFFLFVMVLTQLDLGAILFY